MRRLRLQLALLLAFLTFARAPAARANDAGLGEIARAVRYAEGHFARDPASVPAAIAAIAAAPELVQRSFGVRYAKGRLLERLGRNEEALAAWPSDDEARAIAAELGARVGSDVRLRRARALASLARCEEALAVLRALEAERAFGAGVLKGARGACSTPGTSGTPGAPGAPGVAGQTAAPPSIEQRIARAEQLTAQGRGEEALAQLDALVKGKNKVALPKALKARFMHARGMALFRMRTRYPEAARVLQAASKMAGPTAEEDAFHAARAIARSDQNVRAAQALRAFTRRFPKSKRVAEALYLAAWLELRVDHKGAEQALASWLDGPHAKAEPGLAAEARVELGMRALHDGRHALAAQRFAAYAATTTGCLERGRGLYWGARAELVQGRKAEAVLLLYDAAQIEPLCWYALLARGALRELGEPLPPPYPSGAAALAALDASAVDSSATPPALDASVEASEGSSLAPPPVLAASVSAAPPSLAKVAVALPKDVAFYAALGFDGDAVAALRAQEDAVRASAPAGRALHVLIDAYTSLGEHARPRALVHAAPAGLLTRAPSPETAYALRAAYARPHRALVQELAQREGVDEDFIYAVMLKESTFDPRVVSNADAIGLMQLLPATGRLVGKELGLTVTRETLLDPELNIRLGVRLLRQLMARYRGQMALAAAAYNAGAHRVDGWLARAARAPVKDQAFSLDRFVEDIPIEQTRNYVRRVLAFYARYRYLGPDGLGDGPVIELPASVTR